MKKWILFFLFTISSVVTSDAQEIIFRNFATSLYKAGTQNWDMEQLPDGRMAIANNTGLLIYDGAQWMNFPIRNYSTVRALYYDRHTDRLYAGASGEFGYYRVNPLTYQFEYHSISDLLPSKMRNFGEIWKILPWRGNLVFQSKSHLFIYNGKKIQTFQSSGRIETISNIGGRLILASRHGLEEYMGGHSRMLAHASFKGEVVVRSILAYGRNILLATQDNGILTYDGKQLYPDVSDIAPILRSNQIFCAKLKGDKLAVGTVRAGLIVRNLKNGTTLYLNSNKGLLNNTVLSAYFDKTGYIWMGLDNGISCAMPDVPFRNVVSDRFGIGTGAASIVDGNHLYLGTNQGLYFVNLPFTQYIDYRQPLPVAGISGQVWQLTSIGGTVFCCGDRGLYIIRNGVASKVEGPIGTWMLCELKAHPGYLVATDYMGMVLLKHEGTGCRMVSRVKTNLEMSGNVLEDRDGTLWMSHWQKGVYHLAFSKDMKSLKVLQLFNSKHGLYVDQNNLVCRINGRIYISTVDGFYTYDRKRKQLVKDEAMSRVFNTFGETLNVTETPSHDLWAQKTNFLAIAHVTQKGYVVDSMSYRAVAKSQQLGMGKIYPLANGMTMVNSNDGFYLVHDNFKEKKEDNPLFISRITSTNQGDSIVYRHSVKENGVVQIRLAHSLNSINIEFVQPEFLVDDAIVYSCFLENYDTQWSQSRSNYKEYTQLGKGSYVFHVKAYNRISGKTQETEIKITILPAWYETVWAYLLYFLLACLAFYGLVRYLKFRANRELFIEQTKRKAEVAQMQNEQLQNELKHKSSELASSTMSSIHQNDILQKLDEEMSLLSESVRREDRKSQITSKINDIRSSLQAYLNDDEGWDKFEENFNVVYDDFMKKLTAQFSNLKMSDRKLCAYLRMGLSSKEMAALLNMSVRSIETARYRLRKKLNLESGENLTDFIQNFNKNLQSDQHNEHEK